MDSIAVLLVEADSAVISLVKESLSGKHGQDCAVEESRTLDGALDILASKRFDIVLLALPLPDAAGLDPVRTLASRCPEMAIVILSEPQDEPLALQAVHYGAQDYLDKRQVTPDMLRRSISYALERKKALREKSRLLADLSSTVELIRILQGILPICAGCKRIRDNRGVWAPVTALTQPSLLIDRNRHDICLDCAALADSHQKSYSH